MSLTPLGPSYSQALKIYLSETCTSRYFDHILKCTNKLMLLIVLTRLKWKKCKIMLDHSKCVKTTRQWQETNERIHVHVCGSCVKKKKSSMLGLWIFLTRHSVLLKSTFTLHSGLFLKIRPSLASPKWFSSKEIVKHCLLESNWRLALLHTRLQPRVTVYFFFSIRFIG